MNVLEADSIWLEYHGRKVLQSIYLKVETGRVTGLLGRNGTGKTSLLRMIFGSLRGQSQSVRLNGNYISHPYLENNLIRYLPQTTFTPAGQTIKKVCDLYDVPFSSIINYFPGLEEYKKEKLNTLSGGKIRLFEILLILFSPVSFVLLDEPFTHLDPVSVEMLLSLIKEEKKKKGIVLSDHAYKHVQEASDDLYLIVPGGRSMLLKDPNQDLKSYGYIS
ncbi:ATP-binding cassette domain-containing protein [Dyadobacter subterraneus]|uniref:ATP-binding cassette domain-containing protein n=1 Tax=Dyadobacter subterraneus TaxID=2773304 RepID=A0ABR9WK84_9BACT|nr:ATP-binding cassette domain-containing protein [Dyadobacter subterraneus]MBE9465928.1 ATP-binding cassette domain-containing protein [Dyadobacter subterraneus]